MARIELSNIGGGGTTLSLTTTGTSGAATLAGSVLNIPVYQGQLTLTTTGTSGAATLSGDILNIPQYSGGGGTPAGSAGQVQFNSTPAGSFAASANLAWDNSNVRLNIGAPSAPTARLNVRGGGTTSATATQVWTNSGNTELMRLRDDGRLGIGTSSPSANLQISGSNASLVVTNTGTPGTGNYVEFGFPSASGGEPSLSLIKNGLTIGRVAQRQASTNNVYIGDIDATSGSVYMRSNGIDNVVLFSGSRNLTIQDGATITDSGYRLYVNSNGATHGVRFRAPNANSGTDALLVQNTTVSDLYRIEANGKISYLATNTAAGTTGAQTINRPSGTVNFAAGATALVVTNSLCTTSSIVLPVIRTNDATATIKNVVPAAGSFTINLSAAATAETSVGFFIIN